MKVEKLPAKVATEMIASSPKRAKGAWKELIEEAKKMNSGGRVTGLSRGQVAAFIRQLKVDGLEGVAIEKYTGVIYSVAPKATTK